TEAPGRLSSAVYATAERARQFRAVQGISSWRWKQRASSSPKARRGHSIRGADRAHRLDISAKLAESTSRHAQNGRPGRYSLKLALSTNPAFLKGLNWLPGL